MTDARDLAVSAEIIAAVALRSARLTIRKIQSYDYFDRSDFS